MFGQLKKMLRVAVITAASVVWVVAIWLRLREL